MPEVSVVIPTRDRWPLLSRALAAAFGQRDVELEVIVVDDGSTDETPERLGAIADPRLRVVRNEVGGGVSRARNTGIELATGEWLAFLDDDDIWAPEKLRRQLDAPGAERAAIVYASAVYVDPALEIVNQMSAPDPEGLVESLLCRQAIPGGASNLITRSALAREVGGFDPELRMGEDWDMWIRLLLAGGERAARREEYLYGYYIHGVSAVLLLTDVTEAHYERIDEKFAAERRRRGVELDRVNLSRWLAKNYQRAGDRRGAIGAYLRGARSERNLGNVIRAAGVLFGETAMERLSRHRPEPVERPAWLDLYAPGGPLASLGAESAAT